MGNSPENLKAKPKGLFARALDFIEIVGNKLPHPATIFGGLAVVVVLLSWLTYALGTSAVNPADGQTVTVNNLLSADGIRWMYTNILDNFLRFPPLGYVLVVMVGIGLAEGTGLFAVMIRALVLSAPSKFITAAVVLAGIVSGLAVEAGYVILIPLGAMIFHALGRHPMAGLAAAFCGVSGGFGANFFIGSIDPILAGISTSAAQIIDPDMVINPAVNYYFMIASSFIVLIVGTWVTDRVVEPRLGKYEDTEGLMKEDDSLKPEEKRGLTAAVITVLAALGVVAYMSIPYDGILRGDEGSIRPLLDSIVPLMMIIFILPGIVYGLVTKTITSDKDAAKMTGDSMASMGGYIVLAFVAAQFVAFFNWSNLGIITAISGAGALQAIGLTGIPLIVAFVLVASIINLIIGSASAKWAIMAPIFVPMLMLMGYSPELTQAAYRIGDSYTNILTPLLPYFPLIITFAQKYVKDAGIGTIIALMLPFAIFIALVRIPVLIVWMLTGLPLGPDAPMYYTP